MGFSKYTRMGNKQVSKQAEKLVSISAVFFEQQLKYQQSHLNLCALEKTLKNASVIISKYGL